MHSRTPIGKGRNTYVHTYVKYMITRSASAAHTRVRTVHSSPPPEGRWENVYNTWQSTGHLHIVKCNILLNYSMSCNNLFFNKRTFYSKEKESTCQVGTQLYQQLCISHTPHAHTHLPSLSSLWLQHTATGWRCLPATDRLQPTARPKMRH